MPSRRVTCSVQNTYTKRWRLSWLTSSALVYEPKCGGRGELRGFSQWVGTAVHRSLNNLWRYNSIFNLYNKCMPMESDTERWVEELAALWNIYIVRNVWSPMHRNTFLIFSNTSVFILQSQSYVPSPRPGINSSVIFLVVNWNKYLLESICLLSVTDPGCLSRIQIFPSRIQGQKYFGSA